VPKRLRVCVIFQSINCNSLLFAAQKYKQYNKLRDIISGRVPPPADGAKHKKRKSEIAPPQQTPRKRSRHGETPVKAPAPAEAEGLMNTPAISRQLFSPIAPTSIGPTPHRDGRVLGLFDLLSEKGQNTPSRSSGLPNGDSKVQATPSKGSKGVNDMNEVKLGRTPMSTSKRQLLDTFMTPLKRSDGNSRLKSPTSTTKFEFSTPSFLRRDSAPIPTQDGLYKSPAPLRLPRKPLGRGLSAIVASLRKVEEEQLDDDLDALRDIENEEEGVQPKPAPKPKPKDDILIPDSQAQNQLLGGFDDEAMYDSPVEGELGRDGQPLRIFKKKGQKRTTRRVNMKPVRTKRPASNIKGSTGPEDEEAESSIRETQHDTLSNDTDPVDIGSDSDFDSSAVEADKSSKEKKETKKDGPVKRAARKVNALAHANFKRLKLRNTGSKGGPSHNSRFRRRR
jgi:DNA replication regulator SLD2